MLTYRNPNTNRSVSTSPTEFTDVKFASVSVQKPINPNNQVWKDDSDENFSPNGVQCPVKRLRHSPIKKKCEDGVTRDQTGPNEMPHQHRLRRKLANPVTKATSVETRKRKLRQSTSSDERGVDEDEEESILKRRRINALVDVLTLKKLDHLPVAKRIISIHKKDKNRLSGMDKFQKVINKNDTFTWNMRREVLSLPQRTLREQTLEKAEKYRDIAAKFKRQAFRRIARKEEARNDDKTYRDEDNEYSEDVLKEATVIMYKEVPDLIVAECIINTHKNHKDRLNYTDKNGYAKKAYPTKFVRCLHSEPVNLLRLRVLHEAEDLKDYTDLRRAAVKMNVKNKLARVKCEMLE